METRSIMKKTGRYTDEQRAAARQRDAEFAERATAALSDPQLGQKVAGLLSGSGRLLTYSLRNQALLMEQAAERGMPLVDVDTFKGWQGRGRQVRKGEKGLRIIRPVGREGAEGEEAAAEATEAVDLPDGETEAGGRIRFRVMTVFEVSQTDGPDEADAIGGEPAAVTLYNSLVTQAERLGYNVSAWADEDFGSAVVQVDHEAATIAVTEGADEAEVLAALAQEVAAIAATRATEAASRASERESERASVPSISVI